MEAETCRRRSRHVTVEDKRPGPTRVSEPAKVTLVEEKALWSFLLSYRFRIP
jgi:hypothetical protein